MASESPLDALTRENQRLAAAESASQQRLLDASRELAVLERTVTELTRQSTNDAFAAAKKLAAVEKELEALRASASAAAPPAAAPPAAAAGSADASRLEAKWASLLESLQQEWAAERARLTSDAERAAAAAAEATARAAGERKRLVELMESRIRRVARRRARQWASHPSPARSPRR